MTGRLEGKVAIITGAGSGIGKAASQLFSLEGAKLVLADITEDALKDTMDLVEKEGGEAVMSATDVSREDAVKKMVDLTLSTYSQVDIVCNNAGITGEFHEFHSETGENWLNVYSVNVLGAVYTVKYAAPHMAKRKQGSIVNTASVAGIRSGAGTSAYSASKAALINFTQNAACELGKNNVRVNAVCPGLIRTGMTKIVFTYAEEVGKMDKVGNRCELGRYGFPMEIATSILFLASDDASYITGQALPVDGGNTASLNLPGMKA